MSIDPCDVKENTEAERTEKVTPLDSACYAINSYAMSHPAEGSDLIAAKCRALMHGYNERWKNQRYITLATEEFIETSLNDPCSGKCSGKHRMAGVVDAFIRDGQSVGMLDHKTVSNSTSIDDKASPYWQELTLDSQRKHYALMRWLQGDPIEFIVWDVIRKPGIRPKKLAKKEASQACSERSYCGTILYPEDISAFETDGRESIRMYEARLRLEVAENQHKYFQREFVSLTEFDLLEYASELWEIQKEIGFCNTIERSYKNPASCMNYGSPCAFLGVCSGYDSIESDRWKNRTCVHHELPIAGDGRNLLTHSRIKCFHECKRKHFYKYVLGVEKNEEEEREALYFGSAIHRGLEAWWDTFKENEEHDASSN